MRDSEIKIFDRKIVRQHRNRAAAGFADARFLFEEVADRMSERLEEINRDFDTALDLGCHEGTMGRFLRVKTLVSADLSSQQVAMADGLKLIADEEMLPFKDASFDLITSNLSMHWVNDLPGALVQINRALKPDGLLLASVFGGETLTELRDVLMQAELEVTGGVSPRVSPFADVRDLGGLLQRAGFALPVVDSDTITINYSNPWSLLADLRAMGETNAIAERVKTFTSRKVLMRAMELYAEKYSTDNGKVTATFQVIYMTGWHPHDSQQKPLKPGSATTHISEVLKVKDI